MPCRLVWRPTGRNGVSSSPTGQHLLNYVHSYISGSQGVNITLFFLVLLLLLLLFMLFPCQWCFFFRGGGVCFVFVVVLLFLVFCSTLCSSTVTIDVSCYSCLKVSSIRTAFQHLSIFFSPF